MERWNGRVALVIGATKGIGVTICLELLRHGMIVLGCGRNVYVIPEIARLRYAELAHGKIHFLKCDLSEEQQIHEMFIKIRKKFGHIDVCINSTGVGISSPLMSGRTIDWRKMMKMNILGLGLCAKESLALMKENYIDDGQIIYMNCFLGHTLPKCEDGYYFGFYYSTMRMLRATVESLRQELKSEGCSIRIANISVDFMETVLHQTLKFHFFRCFNAFGKEYLQYQHISDAVTHILSTPNHVNMEDIVMQTIRV